LITFPGHGAPGKNCGEPVTFGCHDCGDAEEKDPYFDLLSECMKKSCPDCYEKWAYRQGLHAAERMTEFLNSKTYMKVLEDAENERWLGALTDPDGTVEEKRLHRIQTYHITISFKGIDILTGEDIKRYRHLAQEISRNHGIFGSCSLPHKRGEDDEGAHFHFLALAGLITPGTDDGTNYIFKNIVNPKVGYPWSFLARLDVIKYGCTHALVTTDDEPSHVVTWSGCVGYRAFPGLAEIDHIKQQPCCPKCQGTQTFKVYGRDWLFHEDVETWAAPDRPPPLVSQRCVSEFA
jgi:hypothetical protein